PTSSAITFAQVLTVLRTASPTSDANKLTGSPEGQPVDWSVAGSPSGRIGLAGAGRPARGVGSPMRSSRAMVTANSGHKSAAVRSLAAVRSAHPVQTWASATGRPQLAIAQVAVIGASPVVSR